ncbi:HD-GYP domain-containing protein [Anaerosinus massiliensis]|uniref:HD-GYP domain-containing protein n=1 Tax=Massilibacillus massiliensis TaxID=1806837 RepID=UPI000AA7AC44|nr:HD-GYP domain-containing protein [Massilibacillus massiliensis]
MTSNQSINKKIVEQKIEYLVPGMELAQDICATNGSILASENTIINKSLIEKLQNWDIEKVAIVAEMTENPLADLEVEQFLNSYNQSVTVVQQAFDNIRQTKEVPIEAFAQTADEIVDNISDNSSLVDQMYNLPKCDDYTFRHSVNVSAIAALIATWLKYPQESISAIALAGLLHDVGKSQLPTEILNKPYKLPPQDYALYQTHTAIGYDLASKIPNVAQSILAGILDHHEREDGSGYPKGLKADDIHPYAKIIAVADMFDEALTINCDTPGVVSPYASLSKIREEIHRIDAKAGIIFMDNMMNFLSGNRVVLSNHQEGRVVFVNKDKPSHSIIQQDDGTVINLAEKEDVCIHHVVK